MGRPLIWAGYVIGVLALSWGILLSLRSTLSYGAWDYVLPIVLVVIPAVSLLLASKWPYIAGVALISAALFMGVPLVTQDIWVAVFYVLPALIAGLAFLLSGIFFWIEESGSP